MPFRYLVGAIEFNFSPAARTTLPKKGLYSRQPAIIFLGHLDCRLAGLAASAGARYAHYADDLAFSGDEAFESHVEHFSTHVAAILHEEGFAVHHRKTRIMRQGVRLRLAGLVINRHPNIIRTDFDGLKAILTNCVRQGPKPQNRDAYPDLRLHLEVESTLWR